MLKNCDTCKYDLFRLCGEEGKTPCDDCYGGNPPTKWEPCENYEPNTNADRIRAMSDEELALFVRAFINSSRCPYDWKGCENCWLKELCNANAYNGELEWLQAPAEGE